MIIDLEKLKPGTWNYKEKIRGDSLDFKGVEFKLVGDVFASYSITKTRKNVKLLIRTEFTLQLICSRCLEEFEKKFEEEATYFLKVGSEPLEEEKVLLEEDIFTLFYPTPEVDTIPLVREMIILAPPMKPLCKPDCKGLCPVCGANLNKEDCGHTKRDEVDPRMAKLLEIKPLFQKEDKNAGS